MAATIQNEEGDLGFQIAPMVDVVFVLMLFFMTCIAFEKEFVLRGNFAQPGYPGTVTTAINVSIAEDGSVLLMDRPIANASDAQVLGLKNWLLDAGQRFGDKDPVVIAPAPTVPHARVMEVLGAVRAAHWSTVTFR